MVLAGALLSYHALVFSGSSLVFLFCLSISNICFFFNSFLGSYEDLAWSLSSRSRGYIWAASIRPFMGVWEGWSDVCLFRPFSSSFFCPFLYLQIVCLLSSLLAFLGCSGHEKRRCVAFLCFFAVSVFHGVYCYPFSFF